MSLLSIGINYGTAIAMIRLTHLGHAGLAMSTSVVALFGFLVLFGILRRRIGGIYGRELVRGVVKVVIASALMGGVVAISSHEMEAHFGASQLARLADLAVSLPAGLLVFYGMCRALGVAELDMAIQAVLRPVRRRLIRPATAPPL